MTPGLIGFCQSKISMEHLHTLDMGLPLMGEQSFHETSKYIDNSVSTYHNTTYDASKRPVTGDCAQCGRPIMDQYFLLANEQIWHVSCLRCALCGCDLQWQTSCFYYKGHLLCRQDYFNCTTCPACGKRFQEGDLVLPFQNGLSFHHECLRCRICKVTLQMGDQCFVEAGERKEVSCLACYQKQNSKKSLRTQSTCFQSVSGSSSSRTPMTVDIKLSTSISSEAIEERTIKVKDRSTIGISVGSENPQKRIRTSFKHDQLRLMKAYFKVNQNPDSKDLRQLSAQTDLSKRVLQVWFQNARAKFRQRTSNKEVRTNETRSIEARTNQSSPISEPGNDN